MKRAFQNLTRNLLTKCNHWIRFERNFIAQLKPSGFSKLALFEMILHCEIPEKEGKYFQKLYSFFYHVK